MDSKTESFSWYEVRAIYVRDGPTGATIERLVHFTAPSHWDESAITEFVADADGRMAFDIEEIEILADSRREHVTETSLAHVGNIELGAV